MVDPDRGLQDGAGAAVQVVVGLFLDVRVPFGHLVPQWPLQHVHMRPQYAGLQRPLNARQDAFILVASVIDASYTAAQFSLLDRELEQLRIERADAVRLNIDL